MEYFNNKKLEKIKFQPTSKIKKSLQKQDSEDDQIQEQHNKNDNQEMEAYFDFGRYHKFLEILQEQKKIFIDDQ
jgi:hypothetical protein